MILQEAFTLGNGLKIPKLALGTWQVSNEEVGSAVQAAIGLGYRHIDTAAAYENESGVGKAIRESGIRAEEVFITSKVPAECKTCAGAKKSIEKSLEYLGKVDLMLIHAPRPWSEMFPQGNKRYFNENLEVWKALEEKYEEKVLGGIGVSNFQIDDLENIISRAKLKPLVNQICVHIGNVPKDLIAYCRQKEILIEAYSPIATGRILSDSKVKGISQKYGTSPAQLSIKFCLQLGLIPLPKTVHPEYMRQNAELDFVISEEDMQELLYLKGM